MLLVDAAPATITAIPTAAAHVVLVITVAITLPNRPFACLRSWTLDEVAIQACALLTKLVTIAFTAAVTAVPSTSSIIVLIVAVLVGSPNRLLTGSYCLFHTAIS